MDISMFLGSNSYGGFYSLYEEYLAATNPEKVWILKGGAGCGKSGFLRRVAQRMEQEGLEVYRILCSGDPDSLDGIRIPALNAALFDGTSPHVLEPPLVGQKGFYVDLSRFYRGEVPDLSPDTAACSEHYRRAYLWLQAAGQAEETLRVPPEAAERIRARALSFAGREIKKSGKGPGRALRVFTDAFTCQGRVSLDETRAALCPRLVSLLTVGDAADCFLRPLADFALRRGWDVILCPDPLLPRRLSHVLIPGLGLGVVSGPGGRRLHLDKTVYAAMDTPERESCREAAALQRSLLTAARKELLLARECHDSLEQLVNSQVDFTGVSRVAAELAETLLAEYRPEPGGEEKSPPPLAFAGSGMLY